MWIIHFMDASSSKNVRGRRQECRARSVSHLLRREIAQNSVHCTRRLNSATTTNFHISCVMMKTTTTTRENAGVEKYFRVGTHLASGEQRGIAEANGSDTTGPEVCDVENRRVFVITLGEQPARLKRRRNDRKIDCTGTNRHSAYRTSFQDFWERREAVGVTTFARSLAR